MVEPISMALISGAAGIGMILGRFTKKESETVEPLPPAFKFESNLPKFDIDPLKLQFFQVEDLVNPTEIIELAKAGTQVFISIKKMMAKADKLYRFIHKLNQAIEVHNLQLHQISKEILLVTKKEFGIQVRTLTRMANEDPDLDDKLLHKSIAGY